MNLSLSRIVRSGFFVWIAIAIAGILFLWPLRQKLRLGIDLVGGTYITLDVHTQKAIESELIARMGGINTVLTENKVEPTAKVIDDRVITLQFSTIDKAQAAGSLIKSLYPDFIQKIFSNSVTLSLPASVEEKIKADAIERNIHVLHTRLDPMSVGETPIAAKGNKQIVIELPDVSDPTQAKAMIGKSAVLEFRLVDKSAASKQDILYQMDGEIPGDMEILSGKELAGHTGEYYLVPKLAQITGSMLRNAQPALSSDGTQVTVAFELTPEGGQKFAEVTGANIGKRLAIVLDGVVISAPRVESQISTNGQITGNFTADSARELATLLRSGSFVAPVSFEEERQIGPALGAESIRQGIVSCLVGLGFLLLFSAFYYKIPGLMAFIALLFNLLLVLLGMSWLGATLTMPGIAGMVLTVGMAIDASILIYERIKEELAHGVALPKAINDGFSDAMTVILDANITTFIVGVVLYIFGTGPIQGFAVTMMLGIVATLITGLFFLRSFLRFVVNTLQVRKLQF